MQHNGTWQSSESTSVPVGFGRVKLYHATDGYLMAVVDIADAPFLNTGDVVSTDTSRHYEIVGTACLSDQLAVRCAAIQAPAP